MRATSLRPGLGVKMDGKLFVITNFEHRTPGNLRAFINIKIKDVISGKSLEKVSASTAKILGRRQRLASLDVESMQAVEGNVTTLAGAEAAEAKRNKGR